MKSPFCLQCQCDSACADEHDSYCRDNGYYDERDEYRADQCKVLNYLNSGRDEEESHVHKQEIRYILYGIFFYYLAKKT